MSSGIVTKQYIIDYLTASRVFIQAMADVSSFEEKAYIATQYAILNKANEAVMQGLLESKSEDVNKQLLEIFDEGFKDLDSVDETGNSFNASTSVKVEA